MNKPLRILWVDDSPDPERCAADALVAEADDFLLSVASSRESFETLLAADRWDLVLSDFKVLGYELLQIIDVVHACDARVAVVILTASGSAVLAAEAIKRGAVDYVVGDAEQLRQLGGTLRRAVERQRGLMATSELSAVLDSSTDGILVVSSTGRVIRSNERARKLWKIPDGMSVNQDFITLQEFLAEQLVDPRTLFDNPLDVDGRCFDVLTFKDGRVFERRSEPQRLAGGSIGRVISYRDISPVTQAEQQLKAALALQMATLDAIADGILVLDNQRRVTGTNRKFQQLWSIPDELLAAGDDARVLRFAIDQLLDPAAFMARVLSLDEGADDTSHDTWQLKDGRVFERYSQLQYIDGIAAGRVWSFRDITAVKMVETALRESEARFRFMFEQTADALITLDADSGRFTDCNSAAVSMLHCSGKQEIIGLHPGQISPLYQADGRLSIDKADEMVGVAMRDGSHRFEWTHCSAHRENFPAEVLLTPIISGAQRRVIATVRDISERKREEQRQLALWEISEAAQSTATLDELFLRIHQTIGALLPAKNFFVALYNEARHQISFPYYVDEYDARPGPIGMSDGTITGRVIERGEALLFTPDSLNDGPLDDANFVGTESLDWLGVPLKSRERTIGALVVQSYDGSVRYTARDKALLEFVCVQVATTIERKQAEAALRESEAQLEEAQRLAHLGSWSWDIDRHVLNWSDETCRIFGVQPGIHVPRFRDFLARIHHEDRDATEALLSQARTDRKTASMEFRIVRESGEIRTLDTQTEARTDDQGRVTHMLGICLDITERKRDALLERDRRLILEQVAKNEPLADILAHIVSMLENRIPGSRCAIHLLEDGRLKIASAPRLPEVYSMAVEAPAIGLTMGSCGTPCLRQETVIVEDIASDPLWDGYRALTKQYALQACWSTPIPASEGGVLGSFAVYRDQPSRPDVPIQDFLMATSRLAALAIEHRRLTDQLSHQGQHDALTGLPNRLLLGDRLGQALAMASRNQHQVAVLFMDLDRFKQINDTLGHSHGDILLCEVARRLESCIRKSDTLARLGGDEFMVVLSELNDEQDAIQVANKLKDALRLPFLLEEHEFFISASIGISIYPADGLDGDTLMANADAAMYRAKETGRDNCMWFTAQMNARMLERVELEAQLRHALALGQFSLHYQPQCGSNGEIQGFEALLRWQHPVLGMVPPSRFIPLAEESGLIVPMGEWVMRQACQRIAAWHRAGHAHLSVSVNVSAVQFRRGDILHTVRQILDDTQLTPNALVLEITESLLLHNATEASSHLNELRRLGVGIAIDDFGTGYSSLSYLQKLPVSSLKIDQSFVCEIGVNSERDGDEAPIIRTIIALARNLGLSVVAEGVETQAQHEWLLALGCDAFQGFFLHRPMAQEDADALLQKMAGLAAASVD